jgi:hypothetical protein
MATTQDMPAMNITMAILLCGDYDPSLAAASSQDLLSFLSSPSSPLPLGSFDSWRVIQEGDPNTATVLHCKKSRETPRKRSKNYTINRFFNAAHMKDGVLVVPTFDKKMMRNVERVIIPHTFSLFSQSSI